MVNCSTYVCCQVAVVENGDAVCREGVSGIIFGVLGTYWGISRWDEGSGAIEFSVIKRCDRTHPHLGQSHDIGCGKKCTSNFTTV